MRKQTIAIMWFKRDLRIADNVALNAAIATGLPVLPLYIFEPDYWAHPTSSDRHWHFIRQCLIELHDALSALGQPLIIHIGNAEAIFKSLIETYDVTSLYAHEETGNHLTYQRDIAIQTLCEAHHIPFHEMAGNSVKRRMASRDGWAKARAIRLQSPTIAPPSHMMPIHDAHSDKLPPIDTPLILNKVGKAAQKGGRKAGLALLDSFLSYRARRYLPSISSPEFGAEFSSRLSPYLAWGSLSEKEVVHRLQNHLKHHNDSLQTFEKRAIKAVLTRLSWRGHFMQKLEDQPAIEFHAMHHFCDDLRKGPPNQNYLAAWQHGRTGYPIIDACMRCLAQTGWIPFRMRAMLVSFASYHLWLDWRITAPHMARLFTDYEPGIHYSQFQMQSGVTGINTIRIYNPIKQSYDHDAKGRFIKRYVPELRSVPLDWLHEPHRMSDDMRQSYGLNDPDNDYPLPIIHNAPAIKSAKQKLAEARNQSGFKTISAQVYHKLGSRNRPPERRKSNRDNRPDKTQLELF